MLQKCDTSASDVYNRQEGDEPTPSAHDSPRGGSDLYKESDGGMEKVMATSEQPMIET